MEDNLIEGLTEDTSPTAEAAVPPLPEARAREENTEMPPAEISADGNFFAQNPPETPSTASELRPTASNPERDWAKEWAELAKEHPEVIGKTLPNDIYEVCINSDRPPLRVYESMMLEKLTGEVARLQKENETLRQNAANSMRAPVTGVAGSGVKNDAEDDFIRGFNNFLNL